MIFCWSQFLDVAKFLKEEANNGIIPKEAAYRCSISRAYYAAFGYALNYAKDNGSYIPENNADDHWKIRKYYLSHGKKEISRKLERLHQWRKFSDYDEPVYNLEINLNESLKTADEIISSL